MTISYRAVAASCIVSSNIHLMYNKQMNDFWWCLYLYIHNNFLYEDDIDNEQLIEDADNTTNTLMMR